jgi:hypothetical protein
MPVDVVDHEHEPATGRYCLIADGGREPTEKMLSRMVQKAKLKKETIIYLHPAYILRKKGL